MYILEIKYRDWIAYGLRLSVDSSNYVTSSQKFLFLSTAKKIVNNCTLKYYRNKKNKRVAIFAKDKPLTSFTSDI